MKSIVYILIAIFISGILIPAFPKNKPDSLQTITLECVSDNHSVELLNKSADIFRLRLNNYGTKYVDIAVNEKLASIQISFEKDVNISDVIYLLETNGQIDFFETFERQDIINDLGLDNDLVKILNIPADNAMFADNSGIYGFCKEDNKAKVELFIEKHYVSQPGKGINFCWSEQANSNGDFYLYLLKPHSSLNNSFISESAINTDLSDKNAVLSIEFDKSGKQIWQDMTKRNIGKSIAIVLDRKVLYAPIVQSEIKEGKCLLTGDFSSNELSRINSLIKYDKLPLEFKMKN